MKIENTWTAAITPFLEDGSVDWAGYNKNINFQINQGIDGVVAVGTTGESPTLSWEEHNRVIEETIACSKDKIYVIAGTGSNSTQEAIESSKHARDAGTNAVLLVDCYYNGPSSSELRDEYYRPIADAVPEVNCIPYIIPGRTGTSLLPEDLAMLSYSCKNINAVKDATGNFDNMKKIRSLCGKDFSIICGDDGATSKMMLDSKIKGNGVISVVSNIVPKAMSDMVVAAIAGDIEKAEKLDKALAPLHSIVVVSVENQRHIPFNSVRMVVDRYRNPLPMKVLMNVLGMPSGPCRQPLGRMSLNGIKVLKDAIYSVMTNNPEILSPICDFYGVDVFSRINDNSIWNSLVKE